MLRVWQKQLVADVPCCELCCYCLLPRSKPWALSMVPHDVPGKGPNQEPILRTSNTCLLAHPGARLKERLQRILFSDAGPVVGASVTALGEEGSLSCKGFGLWWHDASLRNSQRRLGVMAFSMYVSITGSLYREGMHQCRFQSWSPSFMVRYIIASGRIKFIGDLIRVRT